MILRLQTLAVIATASMFMSCGPSNGSRLKENTGTMFAALLPWNDAGEIRLFISTKPEVTALELYTLNDKSEKAIVVSENLGKSQEQNIFVTSAAYAPTPGTLLHLDAKISTETVTEKILFGSTATVPEFGHDSSRKIVLALSGQDGLSMPTDLEFNPKVPNELWIVNKKTEGVVIVKNAGLTSQSSEARADAYGNHFMSKVSSISFAPNGFFATCQDSRNPESQNDDFMGPTLWTSDLSIFAAVNQDPIPNATCGSPDAEILGSHMDMLHQSPLCVGIAHVSDNAYFAFDGGYGNLVYYDFAKDHGPGRTDHSDGRVARYSEVNVKRVDGISSHMMLDPKSNWLYVADTGSGKITRLDIKSGSQTGNLKPHGEPLAKYVGMAGATYEVFVEGLRQPSGLLILNGRLFVSDYASGEIIVYNLETKAEISRIKTEAQGIMGLAASPDGKIWFTDAKADKLYRIDP